MGNSEHLDYSELIWYMYINLYLFFITEHNLVKILIIFKGKKIFSHHSNLMQNGLYFPFFYT